MSGIATIRGILETDATTQSLVGDRIGPAPAVAGEKPPYILMKVSNGEPLNHLGGYAGLTRVEIELAGVAHDYAMAKRIADAARAAIEATGNITVRELGDEISFETDLTLQIHAYIFQVWDP